MFSRMCPACGRGIKENERYQVCSVCKRNYHLGHQCPQDRDARMDIVNPSSLITITRRPTTAVHIPELACWNPLHWMILLWLILVRPDFLKAYKEQSEGEKLKKVSGWLISTLVFLPLLLGVLIGKPHFGSLAGVNRSLVWLYKHWALVGGASLLLWLLSGLLSMFVSGHEDGKLFAIALGVVIFLAEVMAIFVVAVVMDVVKGVGEVVILWTFFIASSVASSVMWGMIEERDGIVGFVAKGLGYLVMFFLSFLITIYVVDRVMGEPEMGIWWTVLAFTVVSLPLTILVSAGELFFVEGVVSSLKNGHLFWLARVAFEVLVVSHVALVWQVAEAWILP